MSDLPGLKSRRNFHDSRGHHMFPHPRHYSPRKADWTAWDRAYAAHLDRHAELVKNPEPMTGDPDVVAHLFTHIEVLESIIAKERLLIQAIRQKYAAGAGLDDKELDEVRRVLREGGVS